MRKKSFNTRRKSTDIRIKKCVRNFYGLIMNTVWCKFGNIIFLYNNKNMSMCVKVRFIFMYM